MLWQHWLTFSCIFRGCLERKPTKHYYFVQFFISPLKMSNNQNKWNHRGKFFKQKKKFTPIQTRDKQLLELLQQLHSGPAENLSQSVLFEGYKQISSFVMVNQEALEWIQRNAGGCALVNPQKPQNAFVQTAVNACVRNKIPVLAVPSLPRILADNIGVDSDLVVFRSKSRNRVIQKIIITIQKLNKQHKMTRERKSLSKYGGLPELNNFPLIEGEHIANYRPLINESEYNRINNLLVQLPDLNFYVVDTRKPPCIGLAPDTFPEIRPYLGFHPKTVWKQLAKKEGGCVLIINIKSNEKNMKKLFHLCITEKVPVLFLPFLNIGSTAAKVPCIGVKNNSPCPLLQQIVSLVRSVAMNYPCPTEDSDDEDEVDEKPKVEMEIDDKQKVLKVETDEEQKYSDIEIDEKQKILKVETLEKQKISDIEIDEK